MSASVTLEPVAWVRSPYAEKFGIPRQSGLAELVESTVEFDRERIPQEALRGLEQVSHVWVIAVFHATADQGWRPTVRPPRLGGSTRLGVFATRSPHRPNPLALSLVRVLGVDDRRLRVLAADLLDGTPVLDLKPYLPWAEAPADARCEWAASPPAALEVAFSTEAEATLAAAPEPSSLRATIEHSLRWDPRPAHQRGDASRSYGVRLAGVNLRFHVEDERLVVDRIEAIDPG